MDAEKKPKDSAKQAAPAGNAVLLQEPGKLKTAKDTLKSPGKLKEWYTDFLLSDVVITSFYVAILFTIKAYFNLDWERFFNGILLFYIIWVALLIAKFAKTFNEYYQKKSKLLQMVCDTNDLPKVIKEMKELSL